MICCFIGRILHIIYPVLIMAVALTAWSSSNQAEVVRITPATGFNFLWNPIPSSQNICGRDKIQSLNRMCSTSSRLQPIEQNCLPIIKSKL